MSTYVPISELAPRDVTVEVEKPGVVVDRTSGIANLLIWFLVIAVIVWLIFVFTNPTWVQRRDLAGFPTGEVDQSRAIIYAIIIALIIVALIYVFRRA